MSVSRNIVVTYFTTYEANLVHLRKAHRLWKKWFWAVGVNDLFAVDQHDKWLRFGLALHTGIEPFSGCIMSLVSDPGSENFGIANAHTMLHQWHDPTLEANDFGALDFKIILEPGAIDHVHNTYIDPNHAVFELVPPEFGNFIQCCYDELGHPLVNHQSAWTVYLDLHHIISQLYEQLPQIVLTDKDNDPLPLLENHQDLPFHEDEDGAYYMGGVGRRLGLDESHSQQLDALAQEDEPDVSVVEEKNLEGLDHAGLVVWEFSDNEDEDVVDEW
ncbi:uncharacterized protein BJ212DRAFT_1479456 [Suillus subaureus]|uniref:Uncharacterized protein n=1 Tax=Suillus subaureus TaxID=48587 RepID=A0A9P7EEA0_9AGAM|nr:uncharacterized protein BJ212DRAFT_1479456 [Suillus subaureus]KAG1818443.1 hypothetical protein BJ212DRAFT_1479456 [Suillus subaureus]